MALSKNSTTDEVLAGIDLSDKRMLVTGASAGLGVETIRALSAHGAEIVGAARDLNKARAALAAAGVSGVGLIELDLASLTSARAAADALVARNAPFDVIIANAGVMACPQATTADGFETQFGTNHLGHFVFINRLLPLLRNPARIVLLSSAAHLRCDVDLDDPNFERTPYEPWTAYSRSKTANVLYAVGLDQRLKTHGVRAVALHPGSIHTELMRHLSPEQSDAIRALSQRASRQYKSIPQGAATTVWCAAVARPQDIGGRYCQDCGVADFTDAPQAGDGVRRYALDPAHAEALWVKSEELVGERFAFG